MAVTATLAIPDTLWERISAMEVRWYGIDPALLQQTALEKGIGISLFKQLPLSWASYYLYECRALVPPIFWFLLVREIYRVEK